MMFGKFLVVGVVGFLIDAGLTQILLAAGVAPAIARIPAIAAAMLFTWLTNRRFTFSVQRKRSIGEASRYTLVALIVALANYGIYVVLVTFGVLPFFAITTATGLQAILSFVGYRRFVFAYPKDPSPISSVDRSVVRE